MGSNLGDRGRSLSAAVTAIESIDGVSEVRRSRVYQTPAIGGPRDQPPFLNACVAANTTLSADELITRLQSVETELGRQRIDRWAARKLDLDLILYGRLVGSSATATVPHPRYTVRRFVVLPAAEVAGDFRDPRFGWTLSELAEHLPTASHDVAPSYPGDDAPFVMALADANAKWGARLWQQLKKRLPESSKSIDDRCGNELRLAPGVRLRRSWDEATCDPSIWVRAYSPHHVAPVQSNDSLHPLPTGVDRPATRPAEPMWANEAFERDAQRSRWPMTSQLFWGGRRQPEYWIEMGDPAWAAGELLAAAESLTCPCQPRPEGWDVSDDANG